MKYLPATLALCLLALAGCRNDPVEKRAELRRDIDATRPANSGSSRARLRELLLGSADTRQDPDPHLRATAAQGLGEIGDPEDFEALREALLGAFADSQTVVRMEAAISLGKLRYTGLTDARRKETIRMLRSRLAFERDAAGRLMEGQYLVRSAMLNTLASLGARDAAIALHEVADRIATDLEGPDAQLLSSPGDEGLVDLCFEHIALMAGVTREQLLERQRLSELRAATLQWLSGKIAEMPQVPDR
ncbi:MAG: HEAT repeat domain-containing protein [Planctomycetes bacterium]|nr:HEAT repeat domain-containing protein [Planctomycetota bacterium]